MKRPFSLLVIHGDGSRALRISLPGWIAYGTLALVAGVAAAMIGLSGDYVLLKREYAQFPGLHQCVEDERAFHSFQPRIAAVRGEISAWKALHAKMWKAFDSAEDSNLSRTAAGGGTLNVDASTMGVELRPARELDLLTTSVAEESPRLRELDRVIEHMGKIMNALPLHWPVHGHITSDYGLRRSPWGGGGQEHHRGLDIRSPPGTPVRSPGAATVVAVSSHGSYGKNVVLDHGNGVKSRYAHLQKLEVKVGQQVEEGQVIGLVGSTGRSTGPHLHYEVLVQGKAVNPHGFLREH